MRLNEAGLTLQRNVSETKIPLKPNYHIIVTTILLAEITIGTDWR